MYSYICFNGHIFYENRKIFDALSEVEKSRILRFLTESDNSKLSNTISRYIEKKPNFVKQFFSKLLRIRNDYSLLIILDITYNHFDRVIKLVGENFIYDLTKVSYFSYNIDISILIKIFINNYAKYSEELKEKLLKYFSNNRKYLYSFICYISDNLYYKFPENIILFFM